MAEDWKGSENQNGAVGPHYFVHYQGWKKTWDEWMPEERLLKHTEENVARQKALVDAQKAEAAAAAAKEHPAPAPEIIVPTAPGVQTRAVNNAIELKSALTPSQAAVPVKTWAEFAAEGSKASL